MKDEVLKITPVQKQTRAGQRTRFKAFVAIGDHNGHVGLGVKCSKEVATAIRGAIVAAKLAIVPVRRGYWGSKMGKPHTVPCKVRVANERARFKSARRHTLCCRSPASAPPFSSASSPRRAAPASSARPSPRSCSPWPASTIATRAPSAKPPPSATSPKRHTSRSSAPTRT